ncbi:sensor protein KdpD [Pedobacter sp. ASV28]|uniref:sensor protein KdpD n=1 Tax=Pedobacter sp. ASV28 TaxID=2795123 RepID=UPI0018EE2453|nr:sensor protein KdpD [Pedobacter sp. ASV28]
MENKVDEFLALLRKSERGKLKIYIGMSPGVGKTYRMLKEAHSLLNNGIDVQIGYIETHLRKETHPLLHGIPIIPRTKVFYRAKELEEMDLQAILNRHPKVVLVDELAHTNVEGSKNEKRWQDVCDILEAGISVISAVNIQHLESINAEVEKITGVEIRERVPDQLLEMADEIVNIDLTADELINRLKEGKIYREDKIGQALQHFFLPEKILQLRELALKEVAHQVERKVNIEVPKQVKLRSEKFLACISSNHETAKTVIRKTARLASYYHSKWIVLYVQQHQEDAGRVRLDKQRHLINNLKLALELGAEVIKLKNNEVAQTIVQTALEKEITTICIGRPSFSLLRAILKLNLFSRLLRSMAKKDIDLVILS